MVKRQAVLLIHGIGEQKPMETLRAFVDAVWRRNQAIHHRFATRNAGSLVFSKPDNVSDSFELRRLTTPQNVADIRTDFFEFYWQHLMQGTTYGHVFSWALTLLARRPGTVPRQLRPAYWLLWVIAVAAFLLALYAVASASGTRTGAASWSPWLSAFASVALVPFAGLIIKNIVGDAARYLHVAPANVQCRHEIRQAGIKVLDALHARDEYDRIILVGHSLGSVIGYDVLTHAWPKYHRPGMAPPPAVPAIDRLDALEALARAEHPAVDAVQRAQRAYANELTANGCRWRVTDFVTLGSPLAHAEILLARDRDDLASKQADRELPTCPPVLESFARKSGPLRRFSFPFDPATPEGFRIAHHAAVFAPTRWTNLYFPSDGFLRGDLIGGPLSGVLGGGIRDVPVKTDARGGVLLHTLYWTFGAEAAAPEHIQALRGAVDLTDAHDRPASPAMSPAPGETVEGSTDDAEA